MFCDDVICFHPAKTYHSSLHWDCIHCFVKCNQSEKKSSKFKENSKTSKTMKEATKENKNDVSRWTQNVQHMVWP